MAKDHDKILRQLSLLAYLMAERRPVTGIDIRRDVEGYAEMNEDAFARRFYADRMELQALGIGVRVDRPIDAAAGEAENYSLRREAFHLPKIAFTDAELAAMQMTLTLLDGEFAYAKPLRLALQQLAWGRANPLAETEPTTVGLAVKGSAGDHAAQTHLAKIEIAVFRRKTLVFDYYSLRRDAVETRTVEPLNVLYWGGEFALLGRCDDRDDIRAFKIKRIRGKIGYLTKGEHDFGGPPAGFDPRAYADRAEWQFGAYKATARIWISERIAWQMERLHHGHGTFVDDDRPAGGIVFTTEFADCRRLATWVMRIGEHARVLDPGELDDEVRRRVALLHDRHRRPTFEHAAAVSEREPEQLRLGGDEPQTAGPVLRPERLARLSSLASILIAAGRAGQTPAVDDLSEQMQVSEQELREDLDVLNVVNFGGGSYVLYAEVTADGRVEVDVDAYADTFERPARLLPVEARALVAALDLVGDHVDANGSLSSARAKIVEAIGLQPGSLLQVTSGSGDDSQIARVASEAIAAHRLLELDYYKADDDVFTTRSVEPYALVNGREGWYVACFDPARDDVRHFRMDRIRTAKVTDTAFKPRPAVDPAANLDGWLRTGEVTASRVARVWIAPERAAWAREDRRVTAELADGAVLVEVAFSSLGYLVRDVVAEGGDAAVIDPADARSAVLTAAQQLHNTHKQTKRRRTAKKPPATR